MFSNFIQLFNITGTHDQLLASCELYRNTAEAQMGLSGADLKGGAV